MMTWKHRLEGGLTQTFINFYLHNFSLASHTPPSPLNYLYHVREGMENIHLLPLSPHSVYSDACFRAVPRRDHKKPENVFRLVRVYKKMKGTPRVGFRSSFDVNIWCFRRFNEDIFEKLKQSLKSITNTPPLSWESSRNSVLWLWNSISKLCRINKSNEFDFINKARSVQVNLKAKLSSKNSPKKRSTSCFRFSDSLWMRRKRQTNCSRTSRKEKEKCRQNTSSLLLVNLKHLQRWGGRGAKGSENWILRLIWQHKSKSKMKFRERLCHYLCGGCRALSAKSTLIRFLMDEKSEQKKPLSCHERCFPKPYVAQDGEAKKRFRNPFLSSYWISWFLHLPYT